MAELLNYDLSLVFNRVYTEMGFAINVLAGRSSSR